MSYLKSNLVKVFPSAYREEVSDKTSSLTTEGQLTSLAVAGLDRQSFVKEDSESNLVIYFQGYKFVVKKSDVTNLFTSGETTIYVKAKIHGRNTPVVPEELSYSPTLTGSDVEGSDFNPDIDGEFRALDFVSTETDGYMKILEKKNNVWNIVENAKIVLNTESITNKDKYTENSINNIFVTSRLESGKHSGEYGALGLYSHAEGIGSKATGNGAHAEGQNTTASGYCSHAEGIGTKALGNYSHAEGLSTSSTGLHSHSEGNYTTASNEYSHAEGVSTVASGKASHAEGHGTKATGDYSTALGTWNMPTYLDDLEVEQNYLLSIGNGINESNRSNIVSVTSENVSVNGELDATTLTVGDIVEVHGDLKTDDINSYSADKLNINTPVDITSADDRQSRITVDIISGHVDKDIFFGSKINASQGIETNTLRTSSGINYLSCRTSEIMLENPKTWNNLVDASVVTKGNINEITHNEKVNVAQAYNRFVTYGAKLMYHLASWNDDVWVDVFVRRNDSNANGYDLFYWNSTQQIVITDGQNAELYAVYSISAEKNE